MSEKMLGYSLLVLGVIVMAASAFSVYAVFVGNARPAALFNFDGVSIPVSALVGDSVPNANSLPEIELLPPAILNQTTNTFAHLFLMGFLVSVGAKIANIGVNLIRPIIIKAKDEQKNP